ncbi:MAG TPA: acyl-CoA dehydrogenase family protein [Pseudonocardiaceae bacterium]|nr:acyl-CoA dehydrogenase family protein [Pseudonocardiaceae bacterium]
MTELLGPAADLAGTAAQLRDLAAGFATQHEQDNRLAPEVLDRLRAAGLMRAGVPASIGGGEAPPAAALGAAETISAGDAATGWCVSIAMTCGLLGGYLTGEGAAETFGDPGSIAAGVWAPRAKARRVDGGLVVSGRWAFASGVTHADYFFGGCLLDEGNGPVMRIVGMPTSEVRILDTWHTNGLRGTGSQDVVADEVYVPERRITSLETEPLDTPLYRFPIFGYFALCIAAVGLGNARAAINDLQELAGHKKTFGARRTLAEKSSTQATLAQAEASLRAARSLFYSAIDDAWQAALTGSVDVELRAGLRLAATHAARTGADVARAMYDLGGGTAIYDESPLQRRFRDASTITAHIQVSQSTWETTGKLLLGVPADIAQL